MASNWEDLYDEIIDQRVAATGEWLLLDPRVKKWLSEAVSSWEGVSTMDREFLVIEGLYIFSQLSCLLMSSRETGIWEDIPMCKPGRSPPEHTTHRSTRRRHIRC